MPAQMRGFPDVIAFKHGVTLLMEIKSQKGKLRPEQQEFADKISAHTAPTLIYLVARSLKDVLETLEKRMC